MTDERREANEIVEALSTSIVAAKLTATELAARIGRSEQSAKQYLTGGATPSGDVLLRMFRKVPGFAKRLGFESHGGPRSVAV